MKIGVLTINNRRRTYFVKKDFQRRFILEYIFLVFIGMLLANGMLYSFLGKGIDTAFYRAHIAITTTGDVVRSPLFLTSMTVVVVAAAVVFGYSLISSWRLGSQLHGISEALKRFKNGDLTVQTTATDSDQLMDLTEIFNRTARHMNKKITSIKEDAGKMEHAVSMIETERDTSLKEVFKYLDSMERHIADFKLR